MCRAGAADQHLGEPEINTGSSSPLSFSFVSEDRSKGGHGWPLARDIRESSARSDAQYRLTARTVRGSAWPGDAGLSRWEGEGLMRTYVTIRQNRE